MTNETKKFIIIVVAVFFLFGTGFTGGYFIRQASDSKRIGQLETTNKQEVAAREAAEKDAAGIRSAYQELVKTSEETGMELERAEALNRKLISGLGEAEDTTEEILKGIDSIIEKVKRLGE